MAHKRKRPQVAGSRNPVAKVAHQFNRAAVVPDKRAKLRARLADSHARSGQLSSGAAPTAQLAAATGRNGRSNMRMRNIIFAGAAMALAAVGGLTAASLRAEAPLGTQLAPVSQLRAEGTLLGAPKSGVDLRVAKLVEPGVMSIVFTNEDMAWDFYHEAVGNGERVCLSDLGPQPAEFHGQRYWLRSC